jgi:diaminopimelate decarboxylase
LQFLHSLGTHAEVISEFELWLAERLGLSGAGIILNGPGKTPRMLARAVEIGAKLVNIDHAGEIPLLARYAATAGRQQPVGVRIVTSIGWSSQFGLSIQTGDAFAAFEEILRHSSLVPTGLHLHIGTGVKSVAAFDQAVREVLAFAETLRTRLGIQIKTYDLGGGYGVPTVRAGDVWDDRMEALGYPSREAFPPDCPTAAQYAARTAALFESLAASDEPPEIILEPGRAITSGSQTLLLTVLASKNTGAVRKLILDGGRNITLPLSWEIHKIFPATRLNQRFDTKCDLYGPLCHPSDIVSRNLNLPALKVGDVIGIMDAGAYFVPNQTNFSNPRPGLVMVDAGRVRLVRRPESFEDMIRLDEITHRLNQAS